MPEKYKKEWKKTGCTLMSDGWTDKKSRSLTNFLVNSPSGTVFLKAINTSVENVVQVVTDSASAYVKAGDLLMEKRKKLFCSPCAAHCIDNILEDIGELLMFKDTIKKAREVCVYINRHAWVLSMFRKFYDKKELKRAGVTRFATTFLTLKSFEENKLPLRAMFASEDWAKSQYASKPEAKRVGTIMLSDVRFWKSVKYCQKCVSPIIKVLRLVDGDAKPAMGYIYEAMDRAKEQIANNFNKQLTKFQYDESFNADTEVKIGLYTTIEKMFPDIETIIKVDQQLEKFKKGEGMFGITMDVSEIRVHLSMQPKREKRGETYDPICLSDMESDDEWITEIEESCLLEDNSWMDVNECFDDDEGLGSTSQRKRGPRNLRHDRHEKEKTVEDELVKL
ncbi:uncharacterized protein LOC126681648 [Mercurialis annua]|uniref:uncharacterized protein LOC126681648 n=1 Tax=Mercurialis annua TaxID=3986 RepID=UPI0024ADB99A|nr:uncharacterized protein LOC126681648 [Mercurialis annua]